MDRVIFKDKALKELKKMGRSDQVLFHKHVKKIMEIGPRRHLSYGVSAFVEEVGQGRIAYKWDDEDETLYILRCFADHKEYEKWYNSYR